MGPECHFWESQSLLLVIEIQPWCFYFLLMMHLRLFRDGITPLRNAQHSHSHPVSLTHSLSLTLSGPISLQRGQVCLIIDIVHNHYLLTACQAALAQGQTADRVQKSLQIILNLLHHWPTVQNVHLHWASLKSALTASKHWTPSTATTVSIFKQYPPQSIQVHAFPHLQARTYIQTCAPPWLIHNHPSLWLYLAAGVKPSFLFYEPQHIFNVNKCSFP